MNEIMYDPENCGKEIINSRGKKVEIRKYHMTEEEMLKKREIWEEDIKDVSSKIRKKAGFIFFNPYRKGIYYYQIKSLFLLGCNEWHNLSDIIKELSKLMSSEIIVRNNVEMTMWEVFRNRSYQHNARKSKDFLGKVQENMVFFQRLSMLHPSGYKLRQVCSAIDIKRVTKKGFVNGLYFYRLSTYSDMDKAFPIRDYTEYELSRNERKYINYKFIGRIISGDKDIFRGILQ